VIHRVQRETLQVWNEAKNMLGWLYILFRKNSLEIVRNNMQVTTTCLQQGRKKMNNGGIQDATTI